MSIGLSPDTIVLPMTLGAEYDVIYSVGPFVHDILAGTITSLTDSVFPSDITSIRNYLFQNNYSLTKVELNYVTDIGISAFSGCSITELSMPSLVETGMQAFAYNPLTEVYLPSLISVGTQMLQGCDSLVSADFPAATVLYRSCFSGCENLETLILRANEVATLEGILQFNGTKIEAGEGYIYVPSDLVESYQTASGWSEFSSQIRSIADLG